MLNRQEHEEQHRSARDVPPVARPKGATWRSLQADGIVWEGQVLLVGGVVDLAARMIVTHRRVAFVRGGEITLEVPRGWLRQEPVLRRDGILELFVSTPDSNPFDEPMSIRLRMREGHPAAGHIIAMLAPGGARRIMPDSVSAIERAKEATPPSTYGGFWSGMDDAEPDARPDVADAGRRLLSLGEDEERPPTDLPPFEPPDRLIRSSSAVPTRQAPNPPSSFSIAGLAPRDQRRSSWGLALRAVALLLLLVTAAAFGAGRLHLNLPGTAPSAEAVLTAPPPTDAPADTVDPANIVDSPTSDGAAGDADLSPDALTAVAVGVGGAEEEPAPVEAASNAVAQAEDSASEPSAPAVTESVTAIPTPAPLIGAEQPDSSSLPVVEPAAQTPAPAAVAEDAATTTEQAPAANAPALVVGDVTVAIESAQRAESLPKYGLPPGSGEWVVLVASVRNNGEAAAALPMSGFRLQDRGSNQVAELDTGVGVIASLAGMQPGRDATESISLDAGASSEVLLLYLLPAGASNDLALTTGDATLDLTPYLAPDDSQTDLVESTLNSTVSG